MAADQDHAALSAGGDPGPGKLSRRASELLAERIALAVPP